MKNADKIRVVAYLISTISDMNEKIENKYLLKFGKDQGVSKNHLAKYYYNPFLKAKINTELYKLDKELEVKEINKREDNWEKLCKLIDNDFDKADAKEIKDIYNDMTEKQVQLHILTNFNKFQQNKVSKQVMKEIESEKEIEYNL